MRDSNPRPGDYESPAEVTLESLAWFEKDEEWIYIGTAGVRMGPECSSAPDDPIFGFSGKPTRI